MEEFWTEVSKDDYLTTELVQVRVLNFYFFIFLFFYFLFSYFFIEFIIYTLKTNYNFCILKLKYITIMKYLVDYLIEIESSNSRDSDSSSSRLVCDDYIISEYTNYFKKTHEFEYSVIIKTHSESEASGKRPEIQFTIPNSRAMSIEIQYINQLIHMLSQSKQEIIEFRVLDELIKLLESLNSYAVVESTTLIAYIRLLTPLYFLNTSFVVKFLHKLFHIIIMTSAYSHKFLTIMKLSVNNIFKFHSLIKQSNYYI